MSKILKNNTASPVDVTDTGVTVPASGQYTIPPQDYPLWAASSDVITVVGDSTLTVNDGSSDLTISDGIDLIKGLFPTFIISTPTISHQTAALADTEYSYALPSGTRQYEVYSLKRGTLKLAYVATESGTNFIKATPGNKLKETRVNPSSSLTLYFQSNKTNDTIIIYSWT